MPTIVVPTDFSKCATNALNYALAYADQLGAEVHLMNVLFPSEGVDSNMYNAFWTYDYLSQRNKVLSDWVKRFQRRSPFPDVPLRSSCVLGFPVPTICEEAEDMGADLIVMGTTGATGIKEMLLGSITAGVLTRTRIPLLAVPQEARYSPTGNVVYATDYNMKIGTNSMLMLQRFLELGHSKLRIVHILDKMGEQRNEEREKALSAQLQHIDHDFHYIHDRDIAHAVSNYVESVDAYALMAVAHEHSLMNRLLYESITRKLVHRTHIPFLVLHDEH
ncbi:MAG: universal stress protein [Saprospiraceae bacterium]